MWIEYGDVLELPTQPSGTQAEAEHRRAAARRHWTCFQVVTDGGRPFHTQNAHVSTCLGILCDEVGMEDQQQHTTKLELVSIMRDSCTILCFLLCCNKNPHHLAELTDFMRCDAIKLVRMPTRHSCEREEECSWWMGLSNENLSQEKLHWIRSTTDPGGATNPINPFYLLSPLLRPQHLPAWHDIQLY